MESTPRLHPRPHCTALQMPPGGSETLLQVVYEGLHMERGAGLRVCTARLEEHAVGKLPLWMAQVATVYAHARGYYLAVHGARRCPLRAVCQASLTVRCRESLALLPVPCCRRNQRRRCRLLHRLLRGGALVERGARRPVPRRHLRLLLGQIERKGEIRGYGGSLEELSPQGAS